jgi:hypothetical protein
MNIKMNRTRNMRDMLLPAASAAKGKIDYLP